MYDTLWYKLWHTIISFLSRISWNRFRAWFTGGRYYDLTDLEQDQIRSLLKPNYYIILTYRKTHLSTYLIGLATWWKTGKWPQYVHVLMNVDDGNIRNDEDFKLIEATGKDGVHFATFMDVFDCDRVCLLRPKGFTDADWVVALDQLLLENGKQYDDLFNLLDDTRNSCVETVRKALMRKRDYALHFAEFEGLIADERNLVPQMFRDCGDFEVALEIKRDRTY